VSVNGYRGEIKLHFKEMMMSVLY